MAKLNISDTKKQLQALASYKHKAKELIDKLRECPADTEAAEELLDVMDTVVEIAVTDKLQELTFSVIAQKRGFSLLGGKREWRQVSKLVVRACIDHALDEIYIAENRKEENNAAT